jgi:peptide/nickel transport system permease protein
MSSQAYTGVERADYSGTEVLNHFAQPSRVWEKIRSNRSGMTGFVLVSFFALVALAVALGLIGTGWSDASGGRWESVSSEHWFGTNLLGQDIFERSVFSVKLAFQIGILVAISSTLLGALSGAVSGWFSDTWADDSMVFLTGVLDSIPFYLFAAAVAFALQGSPWAMQIAMIATFWTTTSRLVRAEVMRLKSRDFVQAALIMGLPLRLVIVRHVLPNTGHILLAQAAIVFVSAIKTEVILSFLGLGVHDGVSWGLMLAESTQEVLAGQFNDLLAASIPLFLLLLGFNLMIDSLQDALDPRQGST